jgi:DNA-binding transcriptional MerR regulator
VSSAKEKAPAAELTIDELAQSVAMPVRTIREYQAVGLLPAPRRKGRVGIYAPSHVARLRLIQRLQERGYSLAAIGDLLSAWRDGADLAEILGLAPDQLVHVDEPGAPATIEQLTMLLPALVPDELDALIAAGVVERCGVDRYCIPSPSLLQLCCDLLNVGYEPGVVLAFFSHMRESVEAVVDAAITALAQRPADAITSELLAVAQRGRGLLSHGMGRLTVHTLGRRLGVEDEVDVSRALSQLLDPKASS